MYVYIYIYIYIINNLTKICNLLFVGLSLLNTRTVCLEIAGSWHHSVYVYMKLDNMSYPQGLLPGTTVTFTRLERRVSASGAVYCQYTPVSTVTVHHDNDLG